MKNEQLLNKVKEFGLNSYEAKIWIALLSRGVSSAGELSEISNVPRSRTYDVLESLEKKGFIFMKLGKPIKYIAVQPNEVLERVKNKVAKDAEKKVDMIDSLKTHEVLTELNQLYSNGIEVIDPTEISGSLKDRDNYYSHLVTMINGAEKDVSIVTTEQGLQRKAEFLLRAIKKAKSRGVKIRVAASYKKETQEVERLKEYASVKNIKSLNARFCIVDGKQVSFNLLNDKDVNPAYDVGVYVNTSFFSQALLSLFDKIWKEEN